MKKENRFLVYLHIKETNGEPFYVGKGSKRRSTSKCGRNKWWQRIVDKYGYDIIILEEGLTNDEALEREVYWINRIGRKSLNAGPLVNMTDGGEGTPNMPQESRDKIAIAMSIRVVSEETRLKMSISRTGVKRTEEEKLHLSIIMKGKPMSTNTRKASKLARSKKVIDTATGIIYPSVKMVAKIFNISQSHLGYQLKGEKPNKTTLKYLEI